MKKILLFIKEYFAQILTVIVIVPLSIIFKQDFIKLLPCLVSIFVMYLDSKFNRYARLVGAINCAVYSIGYFIDGLYGSVISSLLYFCPLQIVTFILWTKNKFKKGTVVKIMNNKWRLLSLLAMAVIAVGYVLIFNNVSSANYNWLQGIQFSLGLGATILIMFGILEGMFVNLVTNVLNFVQYLLIVIDNQPNQLNYLIMAIYTTYCLVIGTISWIKSYKEQQLEKVTKLETIEQSQE